MGSPAIQVSIEFDDNESEKDLDERTPKMPWAGASFLICGEIYGGNPDQKWTRFIPEEPLQPRPPVPRGCFASGRSDKPHLGVKQARRLSVFV